MKFLNLKSTIDKKNCWLFLYIQIFGIQIFKLIVNSQIIIDNIRDL